jgi:cellulose synthase/poly-beta-1,6-N-acetylglucosamine synthase-like glycosyltransferase
MDFSIIIAAFDRPDGLNRLVRGIAQHFVKSPFKFEVLIANNARDEAIARDIDEVVAKYADAGPAHFRSIRETRPGKCRAQNAAIGKTTGEILVFFDDDVDVTPDWLEIAAKFFRDKPDFHVMQGPILMPPEYRDDQEFLRAHARYRTINFVQYPVHMSEIYTLTGANMAMRREVFDRAGLFNEALGPGCSGISEDVEFAQRVIKNGMRIGYEPAAGVIHEVDRSRLSEEFFRRRHEQQGRSRLIYKKQSMASIVPNLLRSIGTLAWYRMIGNERKIYRAKGRYFHYRAMAIEKLKRRKTEAPAV